MMTLRQFSAESSTIPAITSWYLADLSKAQGKHEGKTAFEGQGSQGDLAKKGLMHDLLTGKVRVRL